MKGNDLIFGLKLSTLHYCVECVCVCLCQGGSVTGQNPWILSKLEYLWLQGDMSVHRPTRWHNPFVHFRWLRLDHLLAKYCIIYSWMHQMQLNFTRNDMKTRICSINNVRFISFGGQAQNWLKLCLVIKVLSTISESTVFGWQRNRMDCRIVALYMYMYTIRLY